MSTTTRPTSSALGEPQRVTTGPIVVAITGDDGPAAIETARQLAARSELGVLVVSAVELPQMGGGVDGTAFIPDVRAYVEAQHERVVRQLALAGSDVAAWPLQVVVDEPAHAIVRAALDAHASRIVVCSGRHDLTARVFGEVALRVVRRAPCPVLVVGKGAMRVPPTVAVAAIDFSPSSVVAARAARDLLAPGGTLHLVHVWRRHPVDTPAHVEQDAVYERALPTRFAHVARELLDTPRDIAILPTSLEGDAVEQITAFARAHGADLVAAGRRGHGLLELLFVGRVTTSLLRAAPCAMLVTGEPALAERDALQRALTGTSESRAHGDWGALLDAFTRRNVGRRTRVEVDDPALGAQTQETGYAFFGASYDRHDHRVALMFGDPAAPTTHLTRDVDRVTSVAVETDANGQDVALRLAHGTGQTLLTFLPDAPGAAPAQGG